MLATNKNVPTLDSQARQIWLNYYNDYLRERGTISEAAWRKMRLAIGQGRAKPRRVEQGMVSQSTAVPGEDEQDSTMTIC